MISHSINQAHHTEFLRVHRAAPRIPGLRRTNRKGR